MLVIIVRSYIVIVVASKSNAKEHYLEQQRNKIDDIDKKNIEINKSKRTNERTSQKKLHNNNSKLYFMAEQ